MRRTAQGFTLIEIMVVIAIIAGLVTTVAIVVPKMQETQRQTTCMGNLSQLGQIYLLQAQENRSKAQKYSGVALWLSYRKNASEIKRGDERALICPGDQGVSIPQNPEDQKRWDNVDLENPPSDLCSYAARDFKNHPMNVESPDKEIVGSDRQGNDGKTMHHAGVIIVVYDHGDGGKLTREELGLSSDISQGIAIGPEAQSPKLQKLIFKASKSN